MFIDFLRNSFDMVIGLCDPSALQVNCMPWRELKSSLAHCYEAQVWYGGRIEDLDFLVTCVLMASSNFPAVLRLRSTIRLIVAILYLKDSFNEGDAEVEHRWPYAPIEYIRSCKFLDELVVKELLACTIELAVSLNLVTKAEQRTGIVHLVLQKAAISHTKGKCLLEMVYTKLFVTANAQGISFKQTMIDQGRAQAHYIESLMVLSIAVQMNLSKNLYAVKRLISQIRSGEIQAMQLKLRKWHTPEVECISNGKSHNSLKSGVNVCLASRGKCNRIAGARAFPVHPYEGQILSKKIEQTSILMLVCSIQPQTALIDPRQYRLVDEDSLGSNINHSDRFTKLRVQDKVLCKQYQVLKSIIGHLKAEYRLNCCPLEYTQGSGPDAVVCAAGCNQHCLVKIISHENICSLRVARTQSDCIDFFRVNFNLHVPPKFYCSFGLVFELYGVTY